MEPFEAAETISQPARVAVLHLAAVGILDGTIKYCPQLQQLLHPCLQIFNLKAEERRVSTAGIRLPAHQTDIMQWLHSAVSFRSLYVSACHELDSTLLLLSEQSSIAQRLALPNDRSIL